LPVAVRARGLATGASHYQRACAEAAWALCAWLSGDPAGLRAAEQAADGPATVTSPADAAYWGFDPSAVPADIAVWGERFPLADRLLSDALRTAEERAQPFLLFHVTDALARAQNCGGSWHADQALAELRRAGGRAGRMLPGQLSPQEKAVARLARAGRTNRQIGRELYLSVNTVETHLAHVYRKLGIGRRSELADQELD
jgi:DNA-binding CsgD family transcriptional regulator